MAYVELETLKDYLGITETGDDIILEGAIERAQRLIEVYTGKKFEQYHQTRYYFEDAVGGSNGLTLYLDAPLQTATTVLEGDDDTTADKSTVSSSDYWLQPRNEGPPYYRIELKVNATPSWTFTTDGWIEVAGEWGWSDSPPADIVQACLRWAAHLYQQKDAPWSRTVGNLATGTVEIPEAIAGDVAAILNAYKDPL